MKDYFSLKDSKKAYRDTYCYGTGVTKQKTRSRFNPLRYLMGKVKIIHIPIRSLYK